MRGSSPACGLLGPHWTPEPPTEARGRRVPAPRWPRRPRPVGVWPAGAAGRQTPPGPPRGARRGRRSAAAVGPAATDVAWRARRAPRCAVDSYAAAAGRCRPVRPNPASRSRRSFPDPSPFPHPRPPSPYYGGGHMPWCSGRRVPPRDAASRRCAEAALLTPPSLLSPPSLLPPRWWQPLAAAQQKGYDHSALQSAPQARRVGYDPPPSPPLPYPPLAVDAPPRRPRAASVAPPSSGTPPSLSTPRRGRLPPSRPFLPPLRQPTGVGPWLRRRSLPPARPAAPRPSAACETAKTRRKRARLAVS